MTGESADVKLPLVARPHCVSGVVKVVAASVGMEEHVIDAMVQHHELLSCLELVSRDEEGVL